MSLRRSARGAFWGCTRYPHCRGVVDAPSAGGSAPPQQYDGPRRMTSRYPGVCSHCNSRVEVGDPILYENRRVVGCMACKPGETSLAPRNVAPGARVATTGPAITTNVWDGLIAENPSDALVAPTFTMPPTVEQCASIPLSSITPDEHQMQVINWRNGKAMVAAGAGSGKSTVLLERLAALVREGCPPERIVTLVYNRKAADDLRQRALCRIGFMLGDRLGVFTFHGWAYTLINEWWPNRFGRGRIVGVDNGPSALALGKTAAQASGLLDFMDVKEAVKISELAREALIDFDASNAVERVQQLPTSPSPEMANAIVRFCRVYQGEKSKHGAIDFADMLYVVNRVIDQGGWKSRSLAQKYTHVQVDEAQDINPARLRIATHLAQGARSLVMVGDIRQSVYSFTGARPDLFKSQLEDAALLTLPINRRSTQKIVELGNRICGGRDWNLGGDCEPSPDNTDENAEKVHTWWTESPGEEADEVVKEVTNRIETVPLATDGKMNYACLVRTNAQAGDLEIAFTLRGVPCRVVGSNGGVWANGAGRDFLAYLRAANGEPDQDFAKVANKPARYVKRHLVEEAISSGDIVTHLRQQVSGHTKGAHQLATDIEHLRSLNWEEQCRQTLRYLVRDMVERAGGDNEAMTPDEDRAEAILALHAIAVGLGSLQSIDQQIQQMRLVGERDAAVEISTMHRAKGAEWHTVFVCGLTDKIMPHQKARDIEEERRLFYVAATRAKKVCILSVGGHRPSEFLRDINPIEFPELTAFANARAVPPIIRRNGVVITTIDRDGHEEPLERVEVLKEEETRGRLVPVKAVDTDEAPGMRRASSRQIASFIEKWRNEKKE